MSSHATAKFEVKSWDEKAYHEEALQRGSEVVALNKSESQSLVKTLGERMDSLATALSDGNRAESEALAGKFDERLELRLSALSHLQNAKSESLVKETAEKIDGRIGALAEKYDAELGRFAGIARDLGHQINHGLAGLTTSARAASADVEALPRPGQISGGEDPDLSPRDPAVRDRRDGDIVLRPGLVPADGLTLVRPGEADPLKPGAAAARDREFYFDRMNRMERTRSDGLTGDPWPDL